MTAAAGPTSFVATLRDANDPDGSRDRHIRVPLRGATPPVRLRLPVNEVGTAFDVYELGDRSAWPLGASYVPCPVRG